MSENNVRCIHVVLNSQDKISGTATNFSVKINDGGGVLRNVVAIRPLKFEYYSSNVNNIASELVINGVSIPLETYSVSDPGALLSLNGWQRVRTTSLTTSTSVFHKLKVGVETFPGISASCYLQDPYVYLVRPMEPKVDRFDITLFKPDFSPITTEPLFIAYLAVYCKDI